MPTQDLRFGVVSMYFACNKILLITLDEVQLKTVPAKFHADRMKSQGGVRKSGFSSFRDFVKKIIGGNGRGLAHVIQAYAGNPAIWGFWMCDMRCGSYSPKCVDRGYSAPCWQTYLIFCVWRTCRGLDHPSKLHHPRLHGLGCSTTFTIGRIKIENYNNKNLNKNNTVPSTAGPGNRVCLHTQFPELFE